MSSDNPFAPPRSATLEAAPAAANYVAEGRKLPAGRGLSWFSEAWEIFRMSPGMWIVLFVVFLVAWIVLAIIPLGSLVANLFFPVVMGGIMVGCRDLEQGGKLTFDHLFAGFRKNLGNLLLVGVLGLVGMLVVGFVVGVMAALAIPAFVGSAPTGDLASLLAIGPIVLLVVLVAIALMLPVIMAIWFAPPLVAFHDAQPMAALRASFMASLRNFVPFLVYGVVGLLLGIVALIPLGLGLLVFGPLIWITIYTGYRDIFLEP